MTCYYSRFTLGLVLLAALTAQGCSKSAKEARVLKRAQESFQDGQYDKARIDYLNVLRSNPANATAVLRLGQIWSEEGAPLRASPFLIRAEELAPHDVENRLRLARIYRAFGKTAEAKKEALSLLRQEPGNANALLELAESARSPEDVLAAATAVEQFPEKTLPAYYLAKANLALRRQDSAAAQKELRQALAADPKSIAAHLALGSLYLSEKDMSAADQEFKAAAQFAPVRDPARIAYAQYLMKTDRKDAAAKFLSDLTRQAPDLLPAWTLLAQISLSDKKYDEALANLGNVISRDGDNLDARLAQGMVFLAKGDTQKAIDTLEHLDKVYADAAPVGFQLAQAYLKNKNVPKATVILERIVRANPTYPEAVLLWAQLNLQTGHAPVAVSALEQFLQKRPDFRLAQLLLANAYQAAGRLDDAITAIQKQIVLSPNSAEAYAFLGTVQQQQKKLEDARKSYEKAAELAPNELGPVNFLLGLDLLQKNYAGASERAKEQLDRNPNSAAAHYMKGRLEAVQKNWGAAEAALRKAVELDPKLTAAYDLLLSVYLAADDFPAALNELEAALKKNPKNQNALTLAALVYEKSKEYAKARDAYERLLALHPDYVPALNNLACLYSEHLNEPDKAFELAQKARTLQSSNPTVTDTLGWILYKRGNYREALPLLQESAAKLTDNPEIQYHFGMASYMMGQVADAQRSLLLASQAKADFPGKAEAQKRLALIDKNGSSNPTASSIEELESLVAQQPADVVALARLGKAYEEKGLSEKAAAAYERALTANPQLLTSTLQLAKLYAGPLHAPEKAFALAKKARQLAPSDPEASLLVAQLAYDTGNYTWAHDLLRDVVRQRPEDAAALFSLAWSAYAVGNVDEARGDMQKVVESKPPSPNVEKAKRFLSMTVSQTSGLTTSSKESEIEGVLQSDSAYVPALMVKAAFMTEHSETSKAAEIYQKVLQRFPEFAPAQKLLAALYSDNPKELDEAYSLAMNARKKFPDDPELALTLGKINYQRNDYSAAIQFLQQSNRKQPLDAKGQYYLGMAHVSAGHRAEGLKILEHALAEGLPESISAQAKRTVSQLRGGG
jgi:tetratricopeptide (TPR) repeat protein